MTSRIKEVMMRRIWKIPVFFIVVLLGTSVVAAAIMYTWTPVVHATDILSDSIDDLQALEEVLTSMDSGAYNDTLHQYLEPALSNIVEDNYVYIDNQDSVKKGETALDMLREGVDKIQNNFLDPGTLDPENTTRLEAIQETLVKVGEMLAETLLEDLEKAGLTDPIAIEEYNIGEQYFGEAPNQATYGEQIAKFKDAWKQGVKVLELEWGITSGIARPP